jgi:cold shock protein
LYPIRASKSQPSYKGELHDAQAGTVKCFNPAVGYGFLIEDDGTDVFVHVRAVQHAGFRRLEKGWRIEFSAFTNSKGRMAAKDLSPAALRIQDGRWHAGRWGRPA